MPTDKLFNTDSKIEFIAVFYGTSDSKMILYDEDGTKLKDFGSNRWSAYSVKASSNLYKLITVASRKISPFTYDVYKLPGTLSAIQESLLNSQLILTFPNPADNFLTISNISKSNTSSSIDIYDTNAKMVQQVKLGSNQDIAIIDLSLLKSGFYIYKVNNMPGKFIKK